MECKKELKQEPPFIFLECIKKNDSSKSSQRSFPVGIYIYIYILWGEIGEL
jgi:hypothetical protein